MASKIVVVGDVNGRLSEVFGKVANLHAKNNFAFAIIAGNLFAGSESDPTQQEISKLLQGEIAVPLTTYFAIGKRPLPSAVIERLQSNGGELCPNLSVLGKKVSFKTSSGFKIVAIGGAYSPDSDTTDSNPYSPTYHDKDVESAADYKDADILITSDWPGEITQGSKVQVFNHPHEKPPAGAHGLGDLCTALKPRYHFSSSASFFEREPFFHDAPAPRHITRFLSLAPYGNAAKQKWIYAFNLEPSAPPPDVVPQGTTASPFTMTRKRKQPAAQSNEAPSWRFSNGARDDRDSGRFNKRRRPAAPPPLPQQCYFCLSNPACETHMIVSLGNDVYMATAKGPLTKADTFAGLGFPGNVIIIPLNHSPTISAIPDDESRKSTTEEMQKYQTALQKMVADAGRDAETGQAKLGAVTWEISRRGGVHLHWQFLPVPVDIINRGLVEAGFEVEAENQGYPKFTKTPEENERAKDGDYFRAMIWSEGVQKEIVLPLDPSFRFDLQFGRRVLGKLLGLEDRTNWRDCAQPRPEEEADAARFKEVFKPYDFSLEE